MATALVCTGVTVAFAAAATPGPAVAGMTAKLTLANVNENHDPYGPTTRQVEFVGTGNDQGNVEAFDSSTGAYDNLIGTYVQSAGLAHFRLQVPYPCRVKPQPATGKWFPATNSYQGIEYGARFCNGRGYGFSYYKVQYTITDLQPAAM